MSVFPFCLDWGLGEWSMVTLLIQLALFELALCSCSFRFLESLISQDVFKINPNRPQLTILWFLNADNLGLLILKCFVFNRHLTSKDVQHQSRNIYQSASASSCYHYCFYYLRPVMSLSHYCSFLCSERPFEKVLLVALSPTGCVFSSRYSYHVESSVLKPWSFKNPVYWKFFFYSYFYSQLCHKAFV